MDKTDLRRIMKLRSCVTQARREPFPGFSVTSEAPSFVVAISNFPVEKDQFGLELASRMQSVYCNIVLGGLFPLSCSVLKLMPPPSEAECSEHST